MKKYLISIITAVVIVSFLVTSFTAFAYSNGMIPKKVDTKDQNEIAISRDSDWYYKPSSYAELVGWYQALEANFSNYIEVFKANDLYGTGQATGGYDLYYVRITNESLGFHKPEVLFLGGPHGDETVGTIGMYWFLDWFTRKAFTDEPCLEYDKAWLNWLVDNREIYFEISHNPYGFDHGPQRYDGNGWDLNREADYDGPGDNTGGIWASENGKTLYRFINNHTIRLGCDIHGGARMLIYPWASTYHDLVATSPISGHTYEGSPPDFYFYDAEGLRLGAYMGNGGGDESFDASNVGTIDEYIWYLVQGGIGPWAYAADVVQNPLEDQYVDDETFGNYPGAGIMWFSPEMSNIKNPSESTFGNDTTDGWGWEIRRFILHQTDIAQPYVRWLQGTTENNQIVRTDEPINLQWQVNGSLVVDHTLVQYGTNPDPTQIYDQVTTDYDQYEGQYLGGTGWDDAYDGTTNAIVYNESFMISTPGDYYFVAKAQVDQVYGNVFSPENYGNDPYLRLVKERTNASYYESLTGTDGLEEINGQTWWYSPVIHVTVIYPPDHELVVYDLDVDDYETYNETIMVSATIKNEGINDETNVEVQLLINGTVENSTVIPNLLSTDSESVSFAWNPAIGVYNVSIYAVPVAGENEIGNNKLYKTVHIIPAPSIWYTPNEFTFVTNEGLSESQTLTIGNYYFADAALDFTITDTNSGGDWLSTNITLGTIAQGDQMSISVDVDATGLNVGTYQGSIIIDSNDPDEATITLPVDLSIVYGDDVGVVTINSPTGDVPYGTYAVNATIENFGSNDQPNVIVNCSIYEGYLDYEEDFEINDGDYISAGGQWEYGTPSTGPGSAHSGSYCWGTDLDANYGNDADATLDSPEIMIPNGLTVTLSFWQYYDTESYYDGGNVKVSTDGGASWQLLGSYLDPYPEDAASSNNEGIPGEPCFSGSGAAWEETTFDLTSFAGETVILRWHFGSDGSVSDPGWFIDDVTVSGQYGRADNVLVYYTTETLGLDAFESTDLEFSPDWVAGGGNYTIQVTTLLPGDEDPTNDVLNDIVSVSGPSLAFDPSTYDVGTIMINSTDSTSFDIWNDGVGTLTYSLSESESWLEVSPLSGDSTGEHDTITVNINTTGLTPGMMYHADIIITSDGGTGTFGIDMYVISDETPIEDVVQEVNDRGFPIRHAADGDWAGAQDFLPTLGTISKAEIYLRKFGTPEFDLVVELREGGIDGTLLDTIVFTPAEVPSTWTWFEVDFSDTPVTPGVQYFIVCPPAPSGVTTSFGYEWGYAFGNQYDDGAFWFTRDSGNLWRDLPSMYEFTFRTYGIS